jgi:hypothetical protein
MTREPGLREIWRDPAIRDFVGLSENSWDFTAPETIPGFGPIERGNGLRGSTRKYGALTVGGNYAKVAEGLNVAAARVARPADLAGAIKDAVKVTESGAPFLLAVVVKEGYDFSRYPLEGL